MWQSVTERGSLSERIVAQVERLLAQEELRPGDRLPAEREMARLLGVSRPSLREAVRTLQARGRLVVKHGQGVFVAEPRAETELRAALREGELSLAELFAMREVLEVPAARWAAERITAAEVDGLRRTLGQLADAFDEDPQDFRRLAGLDARFHLGIANAAGNRFLQQTSHVLHDLLLSGMQTTLLLPGRRERSRVEHEAILEALAAGEGGVAGRAARTHIRSAHAAARRRMTEATARPQPGHQAPGRA